MEVSAEVEARFWARIDKKPGHGPNGDCWIFSRLTDPSRYTKFTWTVNGEKKQMDAHRFVLSLTLGRLPKGLATHSCDFRPCCNPSHISEGTYSSNRKECVDRGRNGKIASKLSAIQMTEIRRLADIGYPQRTIAKRFGVYHTTVGRIVRREGGAYQ